MGNHYRSLLVHVDRRRHSPRSRLESEPRIMVLRRFRGTRSRDYRFPARSMLTRACSGNGYLSACRVYTHQGCYRRRQKQRGQMDEADREGGRRWVPTRDPTLAGSQAGHLASQRRLFCDRSAGCAEFGRADPSDDEASDAKPVQETQGARATCVIPPCQTRIFRCGECHQCLSHFYCLLLSEERKWKYALICSLLLMLIFIPF